MRLRWWLFIFALNFFFASIKAVGLYDMRWYVAKTTFDYLKTNDEGVDEITHHTDWILMVAVDDNHIIGPGQVQCRHINPPNEQIVNIMATTKYYPLVYDYDERQIKAIETKNFSYPAQCYRDTYGCISLVHNLCHIVHHDVPADFIRAETNAVLKKDSVKPTVGENLIALIFSENDKGPELTDRMVKVVDFEECKKLFDPDNVYLVDPEEQLCTERVRPEFGDDPIALPSALLFRRDIEDMYVLVGIESKAEEGLSLSTWAPYHCRDEKIPCQ